MINIGHTWINPKLVERVEISGGDDWSKARYPQYGIEYGGRYQVVIVMHSGRAVERIMDGDKLNSLWGDLNA